MKSRDSSALYGLVRDGAVKLFHEGSFYKYPMNLRNLMRFIFLIASFVLVLFSARAGEVAQPKSGEQAYQELLSIKTFAFGGVGYAGITSKGELCFRQVVSSTNALPMFRSALTNGTTEAKLYALCGIRQLAPKEFAKAAKPIVAGNNTVTVMSGCIRKTEKTAKVVSRIKDGRFDRHLKEGSRM